MSYSNDWLFKHINSKPEKQIKLEELNSNNNVCTELKDFVTIGSYNWSNQSTSDRPIIIVPGKANTIINNLNSLNSKQLIKNQYEQFVDENRYHQPKYPIESLFRSVKTCSPDFKFNSIDFVTDRNNLRKLLNFVDETKNDSFRIDLQKVGNFIIFVRNDEKSRQICNDYGKDFENKLTEYDSNNSSYRKIVKYKLGDFKIVTRFEIDAVDGELNSIDFLTSSLKDFKIANKVETFSKETNLCFIKSGEFKQNESVIELTTKSLFNNQFDFPEHKWNQLFFSKTNYLIIGWHQRGRIRKIEKLTFDQVSERCNRTDSNIKNNLAKLNDLLSKIKSFNCEDKQVYSIIYESGNDYLNIYKCDKSHPDFLPKDLYNIE